MNTKAPLWLIAAGSLIAPLSAFSARGPSCQELGTCSYGNDLDWLWAIFWIVILGGIFLGGIKESYQRRGPKGPFFILAAIGLFAISVINIPRWGWIPAAIFGTAIWWLPWLLDQIFPNEGEDATGSDSIEDEGIDPDGAVDTGKPSQSPKKADANDVETSAATVVTVDRKATSTQPRNKTAQSATPGKKVVGTETNDYDAGGKGVVCEIDESEYADVERNEILADEAAKITNPMLEKLSVNRVLNDIDNVNKAYAFELGVLTAIMTRQHGPKWFMEEENEFSLLIVCYATERLHGSKFRQASDREQGDELSDVYHDPKFDRQRTIGSCATEAFWKQGDSDAFYDAFLAAIQ